MVPEGRRPFIERSLTVVPLAMGPRSACTKSNSVMVRYRFVFEPTRPFTSPLEFVVNKLSGGRFRYEVFVESTEPEVDDVITISSELGRSSSVSFKLANAFPHESKFVAALAADAPAEFTVHPAKGVLPPAGSEGFPIVITYTPTKYGTLLSGRLVIQTEEMMWSFEIRGTHPEYVVPEVESKTTSHLDARVARTLGQHSHVNHLKENMDTKEMLAKTRHQQLLEAKMGKGL